MEVGFIILAGGKGSRMGTPKHELIWNGKTFLQNLYEKGQQIPAASVFVSYPEPLAGFHTFPDEGGHFGPISGLYSIMKNTNCEWYISVPVDTPQVPVTVFTELLESARKKEAVYMPLAVNGFTEPILAAFHKNALSALEIMIRQEEYAVRRLSTYVKTVPYEYKGNPDFVTGMNTLEEYKNLTQNIKIQ